MWSRRPYRFERPETEKIRDSEIPNRIDKLLTKAVTPRELEFLNSIRGFYSKNSYLSKGQHDWLPKIEERFSEAVIAERAKFTAGYDEEKRRIAKLCAEYYATTSYFRDLSVKILTDPTFIPSPKQYSAMCENKFAKRMLENENHECSFQEGDLALVRGRSSGTAVLILSVKHVSSPVRGSSECLCSYLSNPLLKQVIRERDLRKYRISKK